MTQLFEVISLLNPKRIAMNTPRNLLKSYISLCLLKGFAHEIGKKSN